MGCYKVEVGQTLTIFSELPTEGIVKKLPNNKGAFVVECKEQLPVGEYTCMDGPDLIDVYLVKQSGTQCIFILPMNVEKRDKRRHERYQYYKMVKMIDMKTRSQTSVLARDISLGGIGLRGNEIPEKNSRIIIVLPVTTVAGEIRWITFTDEGFYFGVYFHSSEAEKKLLNQYIEDVVKKMSIRGSK